MTRELLRDHPMQVGIDCDWLPTVIRKFRSRDIMYSASSIQIFWKDADSDFTIDGFIKIFYTNTFESSKLHETIIIDSENNIDDSIIIMLDNNYKYFKVEYIKNTINVGKLSIVINYV
jgi:hypothetical protein